MGRNLAAILLICLAVNAYAATRAVSGPLEEAAAAGAVQSNLDVVWLTVTAVLVFSMQAGFMALESGLTRPKNSINVAVKNLCDFVVAAAAYWVVGYGLMFGPTAGGLVGVGDFLPQLEAAPALAAFFVFQVMFCGTAATIDSGAVAERTRFGVYVAMTVLVSAVIYPVVGHWAWNGLPEGEANGWLARIGFVDFAGSTVVHGAGAWAALASVIVIGPRVGRFDAEGRPRPLGASSLPMTILGVMLLFFGWFGFNCGSTLAAGAPVAVIALNTAVAGVFGGLSSMALTWLTGDRKPDPARIGNGVLGGLVGVTAGAAYFGTAGAAAVGATAGLVAFFGSRLMLRLRLDDVVDAVSVHGLCGVWGTLAVPAFATPAAMASIGGAGRTALFGSQLLGVAAVAAFAFTVTYAGLRLLKCFGPLRVGREDEERGLNLSEHGVTTDVVDAVLGLAGHRDKLADARPLAVEEGSDLAPLVRQYDDVLAAFQDNTAQLADSEASLKAVLDSALDGVATLDAEGRVTRLNPAAERMFGHREADALGRPLEELILAEADRGPLAEHLAGYDADDLRGFGRRLELLAVRADGTPVAVEVALAAVPSENGAVSFAAFLQDLTERKTFESKLRHSARKAEDASRTKSRFLANMSHEIRTPLNGILGFAELMIEDEQVSAEDRAEYLRTIHNSGRHLMHLINDILDLSKIEAGELTVEAADVSPHEILADVMSVMRVTAVEKGLTLDYGWAGPIPQTVRADGHRLRQMVTNLVGNAVKFTERGGVRVTARLSRPMESGAVSRLEIAVEDTGVGIPADRLAGVFDPFVQSDASVTRKFGGTGLGLAITRKLARAMGGDVTVESEVGTGSRFIVAVEAGVVSETDSVSFPVGDLLPRRQLSASKRTAAELAGRRVLVVDDGETNRRLITLVLRKAGMEVETAVNGREGVDRALAGDFDLVLMDMQMPVLDGYSAAGELRAAGYRRPIVALTAHAMRGDEEKCRDAGCSGYLSKPIESRTLLHTVRDQLPAAAPEPEPAFTAGPGESTHLRVSDGPASAAPPVSTAPSTPKPAPADEYDAELTELTDGYRRSLPEEVERMERSLLSGDWATLSHAAHALLGSAGSLGLPQFTAPARALELSAAARDTAACVATLRKVRRLVERAEAVA